MNERIKELALEARLGPALMLRHWKNIDALTDSEQAELERLKKFSELIVQECINCYSPDDSADDWADKMRKLIEP